MAKIVWVAMAFAVIGAEAVVAQIAPPSSIPPIPPTIDKSIAVPPPIDNSMAKPAPLTNVPSIAGTTPPPPGANSFTEAQVRQRMEDQGYSAIADLKKDAQSIWRGTARKGGVPMSITLDFQGNVVGSPMP